jgi:fumarate reductase flavoprotein subunit
MAAPVAAMDVVIAGAGMSGLAAAIAAAEKGARACVLEKRKSPGGAAAISAGAIWAPTTISRLREYVPDGDPVLQEILVRRLPGDLEWLASHGLKLSATESVGGLGEGRNMLGGESGSHEPFMRSMADRAARLGVQFRYQAALLEARRGSSGFEIRTHTGAAISTRSLILATGGFQGSRQLLTQYLGAERADHLYLRGLAESAGDG